MASTTAIDGKKKGKGMDVSHALYVIFLTVLFAAAILGATRTLFRYVRSQFLPGEEIVIGTFTASGQGLPTDNKAVGTVLASKLERLKRVAGAITGRSVRIVWR